MQLEENFIMK